MGRTGSSVRPPTIPATQLAEDLTNILKSALANSTLQSYKRSWLVYRSYLAEVMLKQVISLPQDPIVVALFVAFLHRRGLKATSIASYMSAIGYAHKLASVSDPTQSAVFQKAVMSLKSKGHSLDTRSPITLSVLQTLIDSLSLASFPNFDKAFVQAVMTVAFYGLFRIGELLATTGGAAQFRVIQLRDVKFSIQGMVIVVCNYKHNHRGATPSIPIAAQQFPNPCPVQSLQEFLKLRGNKPGPLFAFPSGYAIHRSHFDSRLLTLASLCRLDTTALKGHSFRIGGGHLGSC